MIGSCKYHQTKELIERQRKEHDEMQHRAEREFKRHKEEIELLEMERRRQLDEDMRHREEVNKMKFKKEWEYIESEKRKLNLKQYR